MKAALSLILVCACLPVLAMPLGLRMAMRGTALRIDANGQSGAAATVNAEGGTVDSVTSGGYTVVADEGNTLSADGISVATVLNDGTPCDVTSAYDITLAADGRSAFVSLKPPQLVAASADSGELEDSDDHSGFLVVVDSAKVSAKPELDAARGDVLGALPVKTTRGLFYRAGWGDTVTNLTFGEKTRAEGGKLYLGVIKQSGKAGFYTVEISD